MYLVGRVFGDLTVIEWYGIYKDENLWLCRCCCDNRHVVLQSRLIDGSITNCGCKRRGKKRADITGQRFGKLVAKEYLFDDHRNQACWLFQCDCGTEKILSVNQVKWNGVQSCGCLRKERTGSLNRKDISGKRFGRLVAIRPTKFRDSPGTTVWECRCDCGNSAFYSVNELGSGKTQSCGCLYRETRKSFAERRTDLIDDTSIVNLIASKKTRSNNTSGVTGVHFFKDSNKWIAYISYRKKRCYLGLYEKKEDAIKARYQAEKSIHDPAIEKYFDVLPQNRQYEYLEYLKGKSKV